MKKAVILLIVSILCLNLAGCGAGAPSQVTGAQASAVSTGDAGAKTQSPEVFDRKYAFTEMEGLYKTQGRVIVNDKGVAMLSSANILEFNANCSGSVAVTMYSEKTPMSLVDIYFTGYVDDERCEERFHIGEAGETEFLLASGLEAGEHNFRIVRQTEWDHGDTYFTGVRLSGELTAPPKDGELFIEFIGDSLTTGFGILSDLPDSAGSWSGAPVFQDATQAYPYRLGYALSADISVVAIQGIGCACGGQLFTMNDVYKIYPRIYEKDYEYVPERPADIVVINLLANDMETAYAKGMDGNDIVEKAVELVGIVRQTYPEARIVFAPATLYDNISRALERLGGEKAGYYVTSITMDASGKGGHPSVFGHTSAMASLLLTIAEITGMEIYTEE